MKEKFVEKMLAPPEEVEKTIDSVDRFIATSDLNDFTKKQRRSRRYGNSRSGISARQKLMLIRAAARNGSLTLEQLSMMPINFHLDSSRNGRTSLTWRRIWKKHKKTKGNGNKVLMVEEGNYNDGSGFYYARNVVRDAEETFVSDPLRGRGAKYHSTVGDDLLMTPDLTFGSKSSTIPFSLLFSQPANVISKSDYGETSEWIILRPNKRKFERSRRSGRIDRNKWKSYIFGGGKEKYEPTVIEDTEFSDHFYETVTPVYENVMEGEQSSPKKNFVTSRSVYNFYNEKYEDFLSDTQVPHNALPNLYNFLSEVVSDNATQEVRDQNTLGGFIDGENPFIRTPRGMFKSAVKESTLQEYLKKYGLKYRQAAQEGDLQSILEKSTNVIFPLLQTKEMLQADYKKEFFPMYNEIEFTIDPDSEFVDILETAKMEDEFTKNMVQLILSKESTLVSFVKNTSEPSGDRRTEVEQKKVWDLSNEIFAKNSITEELFEKSVTMLGDEYSLNNLSSNQDMFFFNKIVSLAFYAKLQDYIRKKFRTYEEMINGQKAHSEIVMYRIVKYLGGPSGKPIKNYFFLNKSDLETFRFADTQVKVNENYFYEIYSYNLVVGNSYSYSNKKIYPNHSVAVKVNQKPSLKVIENKIAETQNLILSEPPTIPDVNVYPFYNKDDAIGFNFNGSVGNRLMTPVVFSDEEQRRIDKLKKSQNRSDQGKIWYSQDGINRFYEVFRT